MYYWNQDNFQGLKAIGEKYSALEGYELFGQYCLQREQGFKKQAITEVNEFVLLSKNQSLAQQRKIAVELSSLSFWNRDVHQLIAYPLEVYLKDVLTFWTLEEPNNPIPHKWLGSISGDVASYERALELDPKDEISINQVTRSYLDRVDFQTHHLSESFFIGDMSDAKHSLTLAQALIHRLQNEEIKLKMQKKVDYFYRLLGCWEEYTLLGITEPFPNWCASKGEHFDFWSIIYYSCDSK